MDISSLIGTLMSSDSLKSIGSATKTSSSSVKNVLSSALPSLISGAQAQSQDTATGFADALLSHSKDNTSDIASFLGNVDLKDGGKIISHLLGSDSSAQISSIAKSSGVSKKSTSNILSAAAPLLMSLLGKEATSSAGEQSSSAIGSAASSLLGNVDVGSILGSIVGGSSSSSSSSSSALGSLLGKLFKK